jgi:hypothetical protein
MPRGGARPNSGPKKKTVTLPVEAVPSSVSGVASPPSPARPSVPSPLPEFDEAELLDKLYELALEGNPFALKLALEHPERKAKLELLQAQARNLKLRNRALSEHLNKKGIELDADEWEPEEDPVKRPRGLKAVGE